MSTFPLHQFPYTDFQDVNLDYILKNFKVFEDDIASLKTRMTIAEGSIIELSTHMDTAESNISSLTSRMGTAEGRITNLLSRMSTAESNISSLTTRMGTAENNISSLTGHMGIAESNITTLQSQVSGWSSMTAKNNGKIDALASAQSTVYVNIDKSTTPYTVTFSDGNVREWGTEQEYQIDLIIKHILGYYDTIYDTRWYTDLSVYKVTMSDIPGVVFDARPVLHSYNLTNHTFNVTFDCSYLDKALSVNIHNEVADIYDLIVNVNDLTQVIRPVNLCIAHSQNELNQAVYTLRYNDENGDPVSVATNEDVIKLIDMLKTNKNCLNVFLAFTTHDPTDYVKASSYEMTLDPEAVTPSFELDVTFDYVHYQTPPVHLIEFFRIYNYAGQVTIEYFYLS